MEQTREMILGHPELLKVSPSTVRSSLNWISLNLSLPSGTNDISTSAGKDSRGICLIHANPAVLSMPAKSLDRLWKALLQIVHQGNKVVIAPASPASAATTTTTAVTADDTAARKNTNATDSWPGSYTDPTSKVHELLLSYPAIFNVSATAIEATWMVLIKEVCGGDAGLAINLVSESPKLLTMPGFAVRAAWCELCVICKGSKERARSLVANGPGVLWAPVLDPGGS